MMSRVTRRIAVWLFITESLGLESTFTSPNCSSALSVKLRLLPVEMKPRKKGEVLNPGVADVAGGIAGWLALMPD